MGESHHNKTNGVQYAFARTDKGYRLEVKLPWSTLGTTPAAGKKIGLDVHVNDDDDGGDRDTKIMWFGEHDVAWQQPSAFGTAELAGLVGWWKLDENEGTNGRRQLRQRPQRHRPGQPQVAALRRQARRRHRPRAATADFLDVADRRPPSTARPA